MNNLKNEIEEIAARAGWDGYTLLLLICQWLDKQGTGDELLGHLETLAAEED